MACDGVCAVFQAHCLLSFGCYISSISAFWELSCLENVLQHLLSASPVIVKLLISFDPSADKVPTATVRLPILAADQL